MFLRTSRKFYRGISKLSSFFLPFNFTNFTKVSFYKGIILQRYHFTKVSINYRPSSSHLILQILQRYHFTKVSINYRPSSSQSPLDVATHRHCIKVGLKSTSFKVAINVAGRGKNPRVKVFQGLWLSLVILGW